MGQYGECYYELVKMMRKLWQVCNLVHGDLSEYNLLYHRGHLICIDVSQSVEHEHPQATEFLRRDCTNVNDYFKRVGLTTMTVRELFDFCTLETLADDQVEKHLFDLMNDADREIDEAAEALFLCSHIPRQLDEIPMHIYERDAAAVKRGEQPNNIYSTKMSGLAHPQKEESELPVAPEAAPAEEAAAAEEVAAEEVAAEPEAAAAAEEEEDEEEEVANAGESRQGLTKEDNKARKKAIKEANKLKRENKIKKYDKKHKIKKPSGKQSKK